MPWLLDTNQWIMLLKGRCAPLAAKLHEVSPDDVWLCSIVKEELLHGALKYEDTAARMAKLVPLFNGHPSAPYDDAAAEEAAKVRHDLESRRLVIGPRDRQIAGLALSRGWTLVTANTNEFSRVTGLKLEDWDEADRGTGGRIAGFVSAR